MGIRNCLDAGRGETDVVNSSGMRSANAVIPAKAGIQAFQYLPGTGAGRTSLGVGPSPRRVSVGSACRRRSAGFTVLEIVAVLFIFLVALGIGFYSMGDWRAQNRFHGLVAGYKQAVTLARARAIARQKPVILQMVKPIARDSWKSSENYVIQERTRTDTKLPADTNPSADKEYWLEFQFVDEKTKTGLNDYEVFLNGVPIDAGLNYADGDPNSRGQVCFNARGYNISPVLGGVPMSVQADFRTNSLNRHLSITISPLGDLSTRALDMP